jgi:hypothetical protein
VTKISGTLSLTFRNAVIGLLVVTIASCGNLSSSSKGVQATSGSKLPYKLRSSALFPSPISTALEYLVGKNSLPVLAPNKIPTRLSAKTSSTQTSYNISLYQCQSPLPLNSSKIGNAPWCSGLAHYFGNFGGTRYSTSASAGHWLKVLTSHRTQFCGAIANRSIKVGLSQGTQVTMTSTGGSTGYCKMTFDLNGWSVVIGGGTTLNSLSAAKQEALRIIGLMGEVQMPEKHGVVVIQTVGDGDHTLVDWTYGNSLYSISSYHSASEAFSMAGSIAETLPAS